ncbi:ABC transporter permease [Anaerorhabdus sp.]|uniref:ABC transporter permease n=1 Tax=Anaerorhabdus sp. TaxID=1872524 RepID=UPI002FCA3468
MLKKAMFKNPYFLIGFVITSILLILAIVGIFYTPYSPNSIEVIYASLKPSFEHWLGTDKLGRDIFSRIMYAGHLAFGTSICSVSISLFIGGTLGLISGLAGGFIDTVITKFSDVIRSIPGILFALMIIAVLGKGFINTVIAICFITMPSFIRIVRTNVLEIKNREYIQWANIVGVNKIRIALVHVLPNIVSPIIVMATMGVASAILTEASLSYLGLGIQPPNPSWGQMLSEAQANISTAPWEAISVGVCISLMVLGFNLLGDGLRDYLDVKNIK